MLHVNVINTNHVVLHFWKNTIVQLMADNNSKIKSYNYKQLRIYLTRATA